MCGTARGAGDSNIRGIPESAADVSGIGCGTGYCGWLYGGKSQVKKIAFLHVRDLI